VTRSANTIGDAAEALARRVLGGERVRQSGGGRFWKSDVRDRLRIVWEIKGTDRDRFVVTRDMLRKSREAARGMRGSGDRYLPGMIVAFDDKAYAILELEDHAALVTGDAAEEARQLLPPDKSAVRRASTRRPTL
jgi:hypothetical protein